MKRLNLMVASTVGTTLEWYDFFLFGACSVLVFDKVFFAAADPALAMLLSLGTFAAGFLARPLGGILFGLAGDRLGRKKMLVISLLMMGGGTFAIGLLPTYEQIGIAAPIALLALRIIQGVSVGGESTGAILMIAESMPPKQRGFWTSFAMFAGPLANVLTALVMLSVQQIYGADAFLAWAWRIPFFLSAILILVGFWTRRKVEESPVFLELAAKRQKVDAAPLREALQYNWRDMLKAFFVKVSENTFSYMFSTFLLLMATTFLLFPRQQALNALLYASVLEVFVTMGAAVTADKIGRRPVLLTGLLLAAAASFGLFALRPGATPEALQLAVTLCAASHGVITGAMAAYMSELFPARFRYTALSTSYQFASVAGGSVAPLIGALLLRATGSGVSVAVYATAVAIPALIAVVFSRETKGIDLLRQDGARALKD
jgi:MFS family permease